MASLPRAILVGLVVATTVAFQIPTVNTDVRRGLAATETPDEVMDEAAQRERISRAFAAQNARAEVEPRVVKAEQAEMFRERVATLVGDHALVAAMGFSAAWQLASFSSASSYAVGALFGAAYLVLLARYVESVGEQSFDGVRSSGVSQARFALIGVLVLIAGKNRETVEFIPLMLGFFTYQLASFIQVFRPEQE